MTIEDVGSIDLYAISEELGDVKLVITDHLPWGDEWGEHEYLMQEKVSAYVAEIESGKLYESVPAAKGKNVRIVAVLKYAPSRSGESFLGRLVEFFRAAGYLFEWEVFAGDS